MLKKIYRLIRYAEERRNFKREREIKGRQDLNISVNFKPDSESLIIFFVPGADRKTGKESISGGVMSLVSLCEETIKLESVHKASTLMCTFPREFLLLKHINFENSVHIYRLEQAVQYFVAVKKIILHLPDDVAALFLPRLFNREISWLKHIPEVHVNIVNANILLMPSLEEINKIRAFATKITMTAAHSKYCNSFYRNYYGMPLHKFSTWVSPEQYQFKTFGTKKNVIAVSPDNNPNRDRILSLLKSHSNIDVVVLHGMSHDKFKETIANAKWALTFGEGLDGYLVEPIFSGSFAFAVYNEEFFTEDFKGLSGIYSSYAEMELRLLGDIDNLNSETKYSESQLKQFELCSKYYSYDQYKDNVAQFYLGNYTYK